MFHRDRETTGKQRIPKDLQACIVFTNGLTYCGGTHGEAMGFAVEDGIQRAGVRAFLEGFHCERFGFMLRCEAKARFGYGESYDLARCREGLATYDSNGHYIDRTGRNGGTHGLGGVGREAYDRSENGWQVQYVEGYFGWETYVNFEEAVRFYESKGQRAAA